jgi:predicted DNA-binding transcriptional regulator AlpA
MTNLLDINDLRSLLKLGRTAAYQISKDPSFPAAIHLNVRTKRWEVAEVEMWLQSRKGLESPPRRKSGQIKVSDVIDGIRFERVGA